MINSVGGYFLIKSEVLGKKSSMVETFCESFFRSHLNFVPSDCLQNKKLKFAEKSLKFGLSRALLKWI